MRKVSAKPFLLFVFMTLICGCGFPDTADLDGESNAPEVVEVEMEADQLSLPGDGSGEWELGAVPRTPLTRPVHLGKILPEKYRVWGAVIAPNSGTAYMTYLDETDRNNQVTVALVLDVQSGRGLARWKVDEFLAPFAIHPDGQTAIFCRKDGILSARETLYVARRVEGSHIPEMETWKPLVEPDSDDADDMYIKEWEIIWTAFVGERIVTLNNAGKIHLWNRDDLSRVAVFPGVVGMPSVTPDGSGVAFLTDEMVALLDPAGPEITHVQRVGELPKDPVLTFRLDGSVLAIAGKGETTLLDLYTMKQSSAMIDRLSTSQSMELMPDLTWIGDFLYTTRRLYTFDSPIEVWSVTGTRWEKPTGNSLWAVVQEKKSGKRKIVFRAFELPVHQIEQDVEKAFRSQDVIALGTGDEVRIDVSGLPRNKQVEVRKVLSDRLKEMGYRPSNTAQVSLLATLEKPIETDATYFPMIGSGKSKEQHTFRYNIQKARMEFRKGDQKLWSATAYSHAPGSINNDEIPSGGFVSEWGGPDYTLFSEYRLPTFLRGDKNGSVLGSTHLTIDSR